MSPDPLKAGPTSVLPYSIPTLCNQEAMKPKLRKQGPCLWSRYRRNTLEHPRFLQQNHSAALSL